MASPLHQIGFSFDAEQDRVLMKIKMQDMSEFRFLLTRRFVKLLWPLLMKSVDTVVEQQITPEVKANPVAKQSVKAFQHAENVQKANFAQKYEKEVSQLPLGEAPILLAKMTMKAGPKNHQILCLYPKEGQGIELAMDEGLLHSFCKLLTDIVRVADWDLSLSVPGASQVVQPSGQRTIN